MLRAVQDQSREIVETLLKSGGNPNSSLADNPFCPIVWALMKKNMPILRMLINYGGKVNNVSARQVIDPPLFFAHDLEAINLLVNNGADIFVPASNRATVLHVAACNDDIEVISFYLSKGFPIDSRDGLGWTPLMWAVQAEDASIEMVKFLLKKGADINARNHYGETVLCLAGDEIARALNSPKNIQAMLRFLKANGARK